VTGEFLFVCPYNANIKKENAMFQNNLNLYQNHQLPGSGYSENMYGRQYNTALNRFKATLA
jgi:hypothetical protein